MICLSLFFARIEIDEKGIAYRAPGAWFFKKVPFEGIHHSKIAILAEKDHLLLQIRLKPFPKQEVAWFLSLPELRIQ